MSFFPDTLTELRLEISPAIHQEAWQQSQSAASPLTQWSVYLNQVCLHTLLPWLQAEYVPEARAWAGATPLSGELVRGTAIELGNQRFVLIPDKTIDTSELQVPQEWLDHPAWAGDYYLAIQVDPDDLWLRVWGYATHADIKTRGSYDADQRLYCLDAQQLVQDLSVLWVVRQLYPDEPTRAAIAPPTPSPATQAKALPISPSRPLANLGQWLQNRVDEGWQALETLIGGEVEYAFSVRRSTDASVSPIRRAKLLRLPEQDTLLLIAVSPEVDGRVSIQPQLRPLPSALCLPAHLSLTLLLATGEAVQSVQTRDQDNLIQLKRFKCPPGTQFSLQITIDSTVITEDFVV